MAFDLWSNSLDFNIHDADHHIELNKDDLTAIIDGNHIENITLDINLSNPFYLLSDETFVISGNQGEISALYIVQLSHDFDENGSDIYSVIDFIQYR